MGSSIEPNELSSLSREREWVEELDLNIDPCSSLAAHYRTVSLAFIYVLAQPGSLSAGQAQVCLVMAKVGSSIGVSPPAQRPAQPAQSKQNQHLLMIQGLGK
jgi:hypothetical protein